MRIFYWNFNRRTRNKNSFLLLLNQMENWLERSIKILLTTTWMFAANLLEILMGLLNRFSVCFTNYSTHFKQPKWISGSFRSRINELLHWTMPISMFDFEFWLNYHFRNQDTQATFLMCHISCTLRRVYSRILERGSHFFFLVKFLFARLLFPSVFLYT